jgi:hypothetical protein
MAGVKEADLVSGLGCLSLSFCPSGEGFVTSHILDWVGSECLSTVAVMF